MINAMKLLIWTLSALLIFGLFQSCKNGDDTETSDLTIRYFRFSGCPEENYGSWQDTSFLAATTDPKVIKQCLDQLALSFENRSQFPLGKIAAGSAGYNVNASHSFNWHLEEDMWELVDIGIEIYDGCPYNAAELLDYLGTVGNYGGWGNRIVEELEKP